MTTAEEAGSRDLRKVTVLFIRWLLPVAVVVAFVVSGHLGAALSALGDVRPGWAVLLIAIGVTLPVSHAWRWSYLLLRTGTRIPVPGATRVTSLASLLNYAAPGFLGAPAKAIFARDSFRVPVSRSLPTLAVEQVLDALMLLAAGTVAAVAAGTEILQFLDGRELAGDVAAALVIAAIVSLAGMTALLVGTRLLPGFFGSMRVATADLFRSREHRGPILALTGARWSLDMLAVAIASWAVGLRLGVIEILLLANISLLAGLLAPVPGGLGVREAAMAAVAGVLGISIPAILALSILHRAGLAIGLPLTLVGARLYEWSTR